MVDVGSDLIYLKKFQLKDLLFIVVVYLRDLADLLELVAVHVLIPIIDRLFS